MLTVTYAEGHIEAPNAGCHYAECRYAKSCYAECVAPLQKGQIRYSVFSSLTVISSLL
jgi:hypothetical protein